MSSITEEINENRQLTKEQKVIKVRKLLKFVLQFYSYLLFFLQLLTKFEEIKGDQAIPLLLETLKKKEFNRQCRIIGEKYL